MNTFMLITFVAFTALVALISYVKTKGEDTTTKEGYFLAGRGLPGIVICGSLLMTNISAEQLVGQNGQSYTATIGVFGWELIAGFALVLFALVFLSHFMGNGITTIPQFMGMRFGKSVKHLAAVGFMVYYVVAMLPLVLYAGSVVLEQLFGISTMFGISRFATVAICCVAIAPIDAQAPWIPWPMIFAGLIVNDTQYWATNQSIIQRAFGAKNMAEAQKALFGLRCSNASPRFSRLFRASSHFWCLAIRWAHRTWRIRSCC